MKTDTVMFESENDGYAGLGALIGCAAAILMLVFGTGLLVRDFTKPSLRHSSGVAAQVQPQTCQQAHC